MFSLPDLPYAYDALQPTISSRTLHFHHDKHHKTYVDTLNKLLDEAGEAPASLEEVIARSADDPKARKLFNNAAQAWNHAFFWNAMSPQGQSPQGELSGALTKAFGNLDALKAAFVKAGAEHFGSGWVWLVAEGRVLKIISTHDADDFVPKSGVTPLLVCDLWEHSYYLDHQNDRKAYLEAWFDNLPNWAFAAQQWAAAHGEGRGWRYPAPSNGGNAGPDKALDEERRPAF
jgi:Fe-Mn family superoxide dismutase